MASVGVYFAMPRNTIPDYMPDLDPPLMPTESAGRNRRMVQWRKSYTLRGPAWRRISDFGLGATGVGMALASAAFAFVMMKTDIPDPSSGGSEYLLLFARPLHPPGTPIGAPATQTAEHSPTIDFMATGTIRPLPRPADGTGDQIHAQQGPLFPLKAYVLRSVRGGLATISGPTGHFIVESGSLMPNGDQVLSIDRRAGHWVVVTSSGIIEDQ